jgi:hypothetical protein
MDYEFANIVSTKRILISSFVQINLLRKRSLVKYISRLKKQKMLQHWHVRIDVYILAMLVVKSDGS